MNQSSNSLNPILQSTVVTFKKHVLSSQVDGTHYTDMKIQPIEYILANNIPFAEASVIKYVSRWRAKGGIKDLEKAKHFLDIIIESEKHDPNG